MMHKLLIVDDEPLTRQYIRANLPRLHAGWQLVGEAEDGREALELLDGGIACDLVVTDIRMPEMDGLELAAALSERHPGVRLAILSGFDDFGYAQRAMHYGAKHYLLKPIVREELATLLSEAANELEAEKLRNASLHSLRSLSEETKREVVGHFLKAVVSDNNVEIKSLYPLLHRLKVSLVEGVGAMLLLEIDEGQLLRRGVPPSELALFGYILHQTAAELAAGPDGAVVFFDAQQRTVALVGGDHEAELASRCRRFYASVADAMARMTGLAVYGAVGSSESEPLQLAASYREARRLIDGRLFAGGAGALAAPPSVGDAPEADDAAAAKLRRLERALAAVAAGLIDGGDAALDAGLKLYAELMDGRDRDTVYRFGAFLVGRLALIAAGAANGGGRDAALQALVRSLEPAGGGFALAPEATAGAVAERLRPALRPLAARGAERAAPELSEPNIVRDAKAFIRANYAQPLSLALLADKVGVSPGYLSDLFNRNDQESYIKYLTRVRMEQAAELLRRRPALKVYDIAEKVGYVSVKHFSYVFKQFYGVPPGEYQERA